MAEGSWSKAIDWRRPTFLGVSLLAFDGVWEGGSLQAPGPVMAEREMEQGN